MITSRSRTSAVANGLVFIAIVALAVAAIIAIFGLPGPSRNGTTTTSGGMVTPIVPTASLAVNSFRPPPLRFNQSSTIYVTIANTGSSDATNMILSLNSGAFTSPTMTAPADVKAGSSVSVPASVKSSDVQNGVYSVSISASYYDMDGQEKASLGNQQVTVYPVVSVTGLGWLWPFAQLPKSSIGPNDSTEVHFKVASGSKLAQYVGLTSVAVFKGDHQGLTISPQSIELPTIGPQGTTDEFKFTVQSTRAPPGSYPITVEVIFNGVVVAEGTESLTVNN